MFCFFRIVGNISWSPYDHCEINSESLYLNHVCRGHQDGRSMFFRTHILIASWILNLVNARFVLEHILAHKFTQHILYFSLFSLLYLFFFSSLRASAGHLGVRHCRKGLLSRHLTWKHSPYGVLIWMMYVKISINVGT